jgi:ubiquinone/menaquinone biosynthesis C-methylase UbiE
VGIVPPRVTDNAVARWANQRGDDWVNSYRDSWDLPYRRILVEHVAPFEPSSVLELGCNAGPNLRLLAEQFPDARVSGIDVNPPAIREARRSLAALPNVTVTEEDLRSELARLDDATVDCVVSCFALAYIDPDEIESVLGHACRVTRKGLILMEPHPEPGQQAEPSGWQHDYSALLNREHLVVRTEMLESRDRSGEMNAVTIASHARQPRLEALGNEGGDG